MYALLLVPFIEAGLLEPWVQFYAYNSVVYQSKSSIGSYRVDVLQAPSNLCR